MRLSLRFVALLSLPSALFGAWAGCSSPTCEETLDCAPSGLDAASEGGDATSTDGANDALDADAPDGLFVVDGCASNKAPKDDPCVLQDAIGVFVSPLGDDNAAGTENAPVATVAKALSIARLEGKPSIFVCGGTYTARVELSPGPGIAVYGGLGCGLPDASADASSDASAGAGAWTYNGELARFTPAGEGAVLFADQLSSLSVLADLELVAADAVTPGASSIAGFVRSCPAIDLQRVTLLAGRGAIGRNGDAGAFADPAPTAGTNAAGGAVTCTCASGMQTVGGNGGGGGLTPSAGGNGLPNLGGLSPKDGVGGSAGCTAGREGADGRHGDGGLAATQNGSLTSNGFFAPNGAGGGNGGVAQGGGGGGGATVSGGGGGGGCGGCGGQAGAPGGPGGSSFALLVHQSNLRVTSCKLVASSGAHGGTGGNGQLAQDGGAPGTGACSGGTGGKGGHGGGGSGGRGGHSIAIGYVGQAPIVTTTTLTVGDAGLGGDGGTSPVPANAGQGGAPGLTTPTTALP